MTNYIIQVISIQLLLLFIYDLLFAKETFFIINRCYLLASPILSFLLPFMKVKSISEITQTKTPASIHELLPSNDLPLNTFAIENSINYTQAIYILGVIIFSLLLLVKTSRIILLIKNNKIIKKENINIVILKNESIAFSFFNYIFIGAELQKNKRKHIIEHELIHSKQKHTIDLIFFELLKIATWFNPITYLFQNRIRLIHEYLADNATLKTNEKENYINTILSEAFQIDNITFINQFYLKSLIKKRIAMITKRKSKQWKQVKYLTILPIIIIGILYTSCVEEGQTINVVEQEIDYASPVSVTYSDGNGHKIFAGKNLEDVLQKNIHPYIDDNVELKIKQFKNNKKDTINIFVMAINKITKSLVYTKKKKQQKFTYIGGNPVPLKELESYPYFQNTEHEEGSKNGFNKDIHKYVTTNTNQTISTTTDLKKRTSKAYVLFQIDKNGNISKIQCRAEHESLKTEAIRVIKSIPNLVPAKYKGTNVATRYSLPILFNIN